MLAVVLLVSSVGPEVTVVSGAVVSMVKVRLAGDASVFPAASVALASIVCWPTARPE